MKTIYNKRVRGLPSSVTVQAVISFFFLLLASPATNVVNTVALLIYEDPILVQREPNYSLTHSASRA